MNSFYNRSPFITEDGSATLRLNDHQEHYHSVHGAYQESMHVYVGNGLHHFADTSNVKILEMGFGTGLNAILTVANRENRIIHYHAIEAFPLTLQEVQTLNYISFLNEKYHDLYLNMHEIPSNQENILADGFIFTKWHAFIEEMVLERDFQLVYYDAFCPTLQPELWTTDIFAKLYDAMVKGGVLVTYCAKGAVKKSMKMVGFHVETLAGPPGKREMTRCIKK